MRSAETELQNTIELRATASEIVAPKPDLDARAKKKTILKHFLKGFLEGKSLAPKTHFVRDFLQNSLTQPFQCDLRRLSLQNTRELRAMASEIVAPKPDGSRRQSEKKTILKHFLKGFLEGKITSAKMEKIC